jgi:type VI secretion system protein ImpH
MTHNLSHLERCEFFVVLRNLQKHFGLSSEWGADPLTDVKILRVQQPALMNFAGREVQSISEFKITDDKKLLDLKIRNFGMFSPYGPLPIHITEHAIHQRLRWHTEAFNDLVNLPVNRLALLLYRAWAQLKPSVAADNLFENKFETKIAIFSGNNFSATHEDVRKVRSRWPAAYVRKERSLYDLMNIISEFYNVKCRIIPRIGDWFDVPFSESSGSILGNFKLGHSNIGQRFFDSEIKFKVIIGPIDSTKYSKFERDTVHVNSIKRVVNDFVENRFLPIFELHVQTSQDMSGYLGGARIGRSSWLRAKSQLVTLPI